VHSDIVNNEDVGMTDRAGCARFQFETAKPVLISGKDCRQDLDGDLAPESRIECAVDFSHPSGSQRREDLVRTELVARVQGLVRLHGYRRFEKVAGTDVVRK
jgi:hypothetical protein